MGTELYYRVFSYQFVIQSTTKWFKARQNPIVYYWSRATSLKYLCISTSMTQVWPRTETFKYYQMTEKGKDKRTIWLQRCLGLNFDVGAWRQCITIVDVGDPNSQKQSLTSYSCHQHISSKIYVGDLMMVTFSVVNNSYRLRTSWNCYQQNLYSVCVSNINEA